MNVAGKRILVFGDSMSHPGADANPQQSAVVPSYASSSAPGAVLGARLFAAGAQAVQMDAKVGRSATSFWNNEPATTLLAADAAFKPDIVVVFLGTNELGFNMTTDGAAMAKIRDAYRGMGADVIAFGPPSFASATYTAESPAVVAMMKSVFGPDSFIDTRPLTADLTAANLRTGDGVHFQQASAAILGQRMAGEVMASGGGMGVVLLLGAAAMLAYALFR